MPSSIQSGLMYDNGEGVPEDDATAVKWYTKAAEQGNADAQYNLGLCMTDGRGVPEDDATAVKWYTKAAEQGMPVLKEIWALCMPRVKAFQRTT